MPANDKSNLWKTIALILIGVLLGYIVGRFELTSLELQPKEDNKKVEVAEEDDNQPQDPPAIQEVDVDDDPSLGSDAATVTIIDFSDFQCPFCKKFQTNIFPSLKADYIDTGKVKYVYRDFPLNIHPKATNAAIAAECAQDQDKYWELHELLYEKQSDWGTAENVDDALIALAAEIGINNSTFTNCVKEQTYLDEVTADRDAALSYGARGTPTLFINGKILRGVPQSYDSFKNLIEGEL